MFCVNVTLEFVSMNAMSVSVVPFFFNHVFWLIAVPVVFHNAAQVCLGGFMVTGWCFQIHQWFCIYIYLHKLHKYANTLRLH